ncbi:MAG: O-antigen ligase family protein [Parcubacteria group bacterium]|jgi:O-antigen ligase
MKNKKENLSWLWRNAEKVLIVTFFLTFTLNIRKVFLTPYSFLNGGFNEYMTMSFSWADALMIGTIIIYNIKLIISQFRQAKTTGALLENVIRNKSSVIRNYYNDNVSRETFYLLIFLGWVGLSIFWSQYRPIAVYRLLTFVEIALFAYIAVKSLNQQKWVKLAFSAIILNGLFQSLLGIAQFVHNGSLKLHLLGESIIGPNIDGAAKIIIGGEKHIRAYGTLPHPNILAGFLLIPLFIIISEFFQQKFLPTSSLSSSLQTNRDPLPTEKAETRMACENVPHETFLGFIPRWALFIILLTIGSGFLLTFSRSAFLGFFIGFSIFLAWDSYLQSSSRILKSNFKFFISLIIALLLITILLLANTSFFSNQSLQERTLFQNVSYETILKHPFTGVGIGQFVASEYQIHPNLENWQYQPVHNIYLLAFSELGTIGLIFFLLWIFSILEWGSSKNRNTGLLRSLLLTRLSIYCIVLSFLFIPFLDHYFWDIKLGTIIFVLPIIFILALAMDSKRCSTYFLGLL